MKLNGDVARVWFLALYMPEQLQCPTVAFMAVLGLAGFGFAGWTYLSHVKKSKQCAAAA